MRRERAGHTLQPTALVNEAYLRLGPAASAGRTAGISSARPRKRCAASSWTTRARSSQTSAAPGCERVTLTDLDVSAPEADLDVLAVNEALDELAEDRGCPKW